MRRLRQATAFTALLLATGGLALTAGPAYAESYGYIRWTNNSGTAKLLSIIYASGSKAGQEIVHDPDVPGGVTRTSRVPSGYRYFVTGNGGWVTVAIANVPGRVASVCVRAC